VKYLGIEEKGVQEVFMEAHGRSVFEKELDLRRIKRKVQDITSFVHKVSRLSL
jgi:hypothetical protein